MGLTVAIIESDSTAIPAEGEYGLPMVNNHGYYNYHEHNLLLGKNCLQGNQLHVLFRVIK